MVSDNNDFKDLNRLDGELVEFEWKIFFRLKQQQGGRQQRAGTSEIRVRRFCIENECTCFCEPIKRLKQNHEDVLLLAQKNSSRTCSSSFCSRPDSCSQQTRRGWTSAFANR